MLPSGGGIEVEGVCSLDHNVIFFFGGGGGAFFQVPKGTRFTVFYMKAITPVGPSWDNQAVFTGNFFVDFILQTCPSVVMGQLDKCLREVNVTLTEYSCTFV